MKVERFIREYASATKKGINNNELIKKEYKEKAIQVIDNALKFREQGMITATESLQMIIDCFKDWYVCK